MKKFYVRNADGVLVQATAEQIADEKVVKETIDIPDPAPKDDPMKQLEGLIKDIATATAESTAKTSDLVEKMQLKLTAYEKAAAKGFPLPQGDTKPDEKKDPVMYNAFVRRYEDNAKMAGMTTKEAQEFFGEYDLALQGKELQDKFRHPMHQTDEATRIEMAKFWCLVLRAQNDPRAQMKFIDTYGNMAAKTNIGDSGNTFPLPKPLEAEILFFAREASIIMQYARIWPMTSDKMGIPAESSSTSVSWGNTTPASDPAATEVELEANELSAYSTVRNATLADTNSDIVGWINGNLAEAAGLELDNQAFNGTGTPFTGLLGSSGAGYSVVLAGSLISGLDADDLSNMIAKLDGLKKQGARYYMHGQTLHYVRTLKDTDGNPIFLPGNIAGAMPPGIYGYPYSEVVKMPSTQAANSPFILFGNMRYFGLGRRLDVTTLNINPWLYWTTNRTSFKLYQRWGMKVGLRNGFVRMLTSS
jgi:HK97 family phage major capsid protein